MKFLSQYSNLLPSFQSQFSVADLFPGDRFKYAVGAVSFPHVYILYDRIGCPEESKMKEKIEEIGSRLRELRELSKVSTEEMAGHLKVPVETYNCYEDGKLDIPASVLVGIARRLDVDMGLLLTGEEPKMNVFTVTRSGEGVEVERRKQYRYQNLSGKFIHKKAEPFIVTVEPKKGKPSEYSHPGQEFHFVLEGTLKMYIHDNEVVLNQGDSIFFDSSYGHAMEALNDQPARMLVLVM